jgi:hypothetical protein
METMLVETMHVWNAPGKGLFLREKCVVIKSSALILSNFSG